MGREGCRSTGGAPPALQHLHYNTATPNQSHPHHRPRRSAADWLKSVCALPAFWDMVEEYEKRRNVAQSQGLLQDVFDGGAFQRLRANKPGGLQRAASVPA